jgi:hypothetical protein
VDPKIICNGFSCKLIKDAINIKEGSFLFERSNTYYQGGKFRIDDPNKRGGCERYIYIIILPDGLSQIKEEVINSFAFDIKSKLELLHMDPPKEFFLDIRDKWEDKFNSILNPTSISDSKYFLREKLNVISLSIQMVLNNIKDKDPRSKEILEEALDEIFAIEDSLKIINKDYTNSKELIH